MPLQCRQPGIIRSRMRWKSLRLVLRRLVLIVRGSRYLIERTAKVLARLRNSAVSQGPSLFAVAIRGLFAGFKPLSSKSACYTANLRAVVWYGYWLFDRHREQGILFIATSRDFILNICSSICFLYFVASCTEEQMFTYRYERYYAA